MYDINKLLINLIGSEICGRPLDGVAEISEEELNLLYKISKSHDLAHLIVAPLEQISALKPDYPVTEKFKKALFTAIFRYEKSNFDLAQITELFASEGIDHMPLKGAVIRSFYPKLYLRTSCDLDILVRPEEVDRAAELLVDRLNYRCETKGKYDVSLFTPSNGHIELHYGLNGNNFKEAASLADVWQNGKTKEVSPHRFEMTPEMFLLFHIYHTAKHFAHGGCGIKPFVDLWIIENKKGYDVEKAIDLLTENGLYDFYENALLLSKIWFDEEEYTSITKDMEDFVLKGGVYGNLEQGIAMSQNKKGGKLGYLLSRMFISYKAMLVYYPSLSKCPILFPLYQVRRWFKIAFCGGRKRALNEIKLNQNLSEIKKEKAKRLIEELGL